MKIEVLGAYGGETRDCRLTCLLLNDHVALDAGSLSRALSAERQLEVESIILTHSHVDHTNSIPFFIENVFSRPRNLEIYASAATIYAVRKYLFNNSTWPDFTRLPNHLMPAVKFHEIQDETPFELGGMRFTPIPVSHLVPTHGFLIEEGGKSFIWSSDTGPTERLWEIANVARNLQAVCIDTSFHNALQEIADVSGHLTPRTLESELQKLDNQVPVYLHHLKPPCIEKIREEVSALAYPDLRYLEQGKVYHF